MKRGARQARKNVLRMGELSLDLDLDLIPKFLRRGNEITTLVERIQ